jgi:hypothetical protein
VADQSTLEAALSYAPRSWRVLPCVGKVPTNVWTGHPLSDWQNVASADPTVILRWWGQRPDCNVGVQLGHHSGLIDVECDTEEAERNLVELLGEELASAVPQFRGKRGLHRLFAWSPGFPEKASFHWRGVEFRVGGGDKGAQSIFPPSTHPDGPRYQWVVPLNGEALAPLPAWVIEKVAAEADDGGGGQADAGVGGEKVPEGRRHKALLSLAGKLCDTITGEALSAALHAYNREHCEPPLPDKEVERIAADYTKKSNGFGLNPPKFVRSGKKASGTTPPPPFADFPTDALPPVLRNFVVETAKAMCCPTAYVAMPVLAGVFGSIGNTRRVLVKKRWTEPAVAWFAIISPSGTLKTPAATQALAPLRKAAARLARERAEALKAFAWDKEKYQKVRAEALKDGKEMPAAPECPPDTRVLVQDVTIEKLATLLVDNPRGLLMPRDELAAWVGSMTRYGGKDSATGDLPFWLSVFTAEPHMVDRKTGDRPSIFVPSTAVSIFGGIQPAMWRRVLTATHHDSGLAARLLVAWPPRMKKVWTDDEASNSTVADYEKLLTDLLALEMDTGEDGPEPVVVKMTEGGHAAFVRFYGEWAERQFGADDEPRAALAKLEGYCARFALVHHVVSRVAAGQDTSDPIEAASVEAAYELVKFFAAEAERAYVRFAEDVQTTQRRNLIDFIRAHDGQATPRQLVRSNRCSYPNAAAARAALDALVAANLGCWETVSTCGRPSDVFRLHAPPPEDEDPCPPSDDQSMLAVHRSPVSQGNAATYYGAVKELAEQRGQAVAAARCHAKVATLAFEDGLRLAFEGSMNLSTNRNLEQMTVINDAGLHDWHAGWIEQRVKESEAG